MQDNIDAWQEQVEPHLGLSREHAALCAAVLQQLALGAIALEFGAILFDRAPHMGRPSYAEIAQAVLGVVLVVVFCNQVVPTLLFDLTRGRWAARLLWPIRLLLWLDHSNYGLRALLLLGRLARRHAGHAPRRRPPATSRPCSKPARKKASSKRPTAIWSVPPSSLATSWCVR